MPSERALRRRCDRLLSTLDLPSLSLRGSLDVPALCERLAEQRGRPIRLVEHPMLVPGPFGCWIATASTDYVLYQQHTTRPHQRHIILHEVGHILAGHAAAEGAPAAPPQRPAEAYPDIDPDAVRRALFRNSYSDSQEREAETIATMILQRASVLDRIGASADPRDSGDAVHRLGAVLSDPESWL